MAQALDYLRKTSKGGARRGGGTWPLTGKPVTQKPQEYTPPLNWLRKPSDEGRGEQLNWLRDYKQQPIQEQQPQPDNRTLLRERLLSNVQGPKRGGWDVGINDIWTLDVLNRMWGSNSATEQERILRQNATQPGWMWTPYANQRRTAYVPIGNMNIEKKLKTSYQVPNTNYTGGGSGGGYGYDWGGGGGGGYGYDWGGGGGGGGGGNGGGANWYNDLMTWRIK